MSVIKVRHERNYFCLSNDVVNNPDISFKAKGILAYLLSKPNDWIVMIDDIVKHSSDGRSAIRSGIKELEDAGYITRERQRDEQGRITGWMYTVSEIPSNSQSSPKCDFPTSDNPTSGNDPLLSTDIQSTDLTNNDNNDENGSLPTAPDQITFSFDGTVMRFINWYCRTLYANRYGTAHPNLNRSQLRNVHDKLLSFMGEFSVDLDDLCEMAKSFFNSVESNDHHIHHFVSGEMLEIRFYDCGIY